MYLVNTVGDIPYVDLHHIPDKTCKEQVHNLIHNYKPFKTNRTDLNMDIIFQVYTSFQRARRIFLAEKQNGSD